MKLTPFICVSGRYKMLRRVGVSIPNWQLLKKGKEREKQNKGGLSRKRGTYVVAQI